VGNLFCTAVLALDSFRRSACCCGCGTFVTLHLSASRPGGPFLPEKEYSFQSRLIRQILQTGRIRASRSLIIFFSLGRRGCVYTKGVDLNMREGSRSSENYRGNAFSITHLSSHLIRHNIATSRSMPKDATKRIITVTSKSHTFCLDPWWRSAQVCVWYLSPPSPLIDFVSGSHYEICPTILLEGVRSLAKARKLTPFVHPSPIFGLGCVGFLSPFFFFLIYFFNFFFFFFRDMCFSGVYVNSGRVAFC